MGAGVGAAGVGELLDEPQAFLLEGEGDGLGAVGGGDGGGGCGGGGGVDGGGERLDGGVVEEGAEREGAGEGGLEPGGEAQRHERVAAEGEEVVGEADLGEAEEIGHGCGHGGLGGGAGRDMGGAGEGAGLAGRAGSARRSSLPLTVIGRRRRPAKRCGVMCSGRTARALARSAARSRCGARSKGAPLLSAPSAPVSSPPIPSGTRKACSTPSG